MIPGNTKEIKQVVFEVPSTCQYLLHSHNKRNSLSCHTLNRFCKRLHLPPYFLSILPVLQSIARKTLIWGDFIIKPQSVQFIFYPLQASDISNLIRYLLFQFEWDNERNCVTVNLLKCLWQSIYPLFRVAGGRITAVFGLKVGSSW